ncbi:hypothetical protein BJ138DRAFT_1085554 [Hygrophoropsis aurantiaca]|uniref:Uncharacterized protein n=1 Tax=Hygrophoropsis aurantiaca TaxID=72124 RepID=A0ACB8AEF8_9AGAM|nr:hypothetical protein BJ138DRAFT_1085554 [Hygrophoropsis aurantiaca]
MSLPGTGGLSVTQEMLDILAQPGFISNAMGGSKLRHLFSQQSLALNPELLSPFSLLCFIGAHDLVKKVTISYCDCRWHGPDLTGTETPFQLGYTVLVVAGAQRVVPRSDSPSDYPATLRLLLGNGAPPDVPNVVGMSALGYACVAPATKLDLARVLLEGGANVDHQDRYGDTALFHALMGNDVPMVELLMEYGADLDICEANGMCVRKSVANFGPEVTAVVLRWERKRKGEEALLDDKNCVQCGRKTANQCSACHTVRYCSKECQKSHWRTHKPRCQAFSTSATISVKPTYGEHSLGIPLSAVTRQVFGIPTAESKKPATFKCKPVSANPTPGGMIIKIQLPFAKGGSDRSMFVYNRKHDFVCSIKETENPTQYEEIAKVILAKGISGAKAYFAAELKSRDELVIKTSEVLAAQPF